MRIDLSGLSMECHYLLHVDEHLWYYQGLTLLVVTVLLSKYSV